MCTEHLFIAPGKNLIIKKFKTKNISLFRII